MSADKDSNTLRVLTSIATNLQRRVAVYVRRVLTIETGKTLGDIDSRSQLLWPASIAISPTLRSHDATYTRAVPQECCNNYLPADGPRSVSV